MSTAENLDVDILGSGGDGEQFLTFILADEEYGVDILRVQEIRGWDTVTQIPNTPDYMKGVINLRGTIVPIVDLRARFNLETVEYSAITVVIVLKVVSNDKERVVGIVVDAVSDTYSIPQGEIKDAPEFGGAVSIDYVKGLATVDEKMLILLDIDHLLDSGELESISRQA